MTDHVEKERLLSEYDRLEDRVEDSAAGPIWDLADWLADNTTRNAGQGERTDLAPPGARSGVSLNDLAERRGRSVRYLQKLRQVAEATRPDRMPDVSVRVYLKTLTDNGWILPDANTALRDRGTRLRDHGRMESADATRRQVQSLPTEAKREIIADLAKDPEVEQAIRREAERSVQRHAERIERGQERIESERRGRTDMRWMELEGKLAKAKVLAREALVLASEVDWTDEHRELSGEDVAAVVAAWQMVEVAFTGESDIDWDAGLARLS